MAIIIDESEWDEIEIIIEEIPDELEVEEGEGD